MEYEKGYLLQRKQGTQEAQESGSSGGCSWSKLGARQRWAGGTVAGEEIAQDFVPAVRTPPPDGGAVAGC